MSRFSGKCDLFDHICMEQTYDKGNCKISDEMECFELFKERTGGIIYQNIPLELTERNIDNEIKKVNDSKVLSKIEHKSIKFDKRLKTGSKEVINYTYIYYDKEYESLKEINKIGYCTVKEIHFNTLLDLIPYYPYIIIMASWGNKKEHVVLANESFVDTEEKQALKYGYETKMTAIYKKALQEHYISVVLRYFNTEGRILTETLDVFKDGKDLFVKTTHPIDYNFDIDVERTLHDWIYTHPKCLKDEDFNTGLVYVGDIWPNELKVGDKLTLTYVKKIKHELYLEG